MRAHYLSMSRMSLAYLCAFGMRSDAAQFPRPAGAAAQTGSVVHAHIERHVNHDEGPPDFGKYSTDVLAEAAELFSPKLRGWLDATAWTACEIGIRYDSAIDSSTVGPRRGEPGYEDVGPRVLPGTLDLVHVDYAESLVTVVDAKSGKLVTDTEQLRAQAVAASRLYGVKRARVGYVYARKTKCDEPKWTYLDEDALDLEAGRIARLLRTLPMAKPAPGDDHCWKCDARPGCPAFGAALAQNDRAQLEAAGFFS